MKLVNLFRKGWRFLLCVAAVIFTANACAEVVVIVSASSPVTRLTAEQTAKIFLGKVNNFPNDSVAIPIPIDQAEGNATRDEFYTKVVHKSSSQLTAYWAKIIFTGDGHPPKLLEGDIVVRMAVASNPNAIGYIDRKAVDNSVRIILAP